jgi:hypothetical protein
MKHATLIHGESVGIYLHELTIAKAQFRCNQYYYRKLRAEMYVVVMMHQRKRKKIIPRIFLKLNFYNTYSLDSI